VFSKVINTGKCHLALMGWLYNKFLSRIKIEITFIFKTLTFLPCLFLRLPICCFIVLETFKLHSAIFRLIAGESGQRFVTKWGKIASSFTCLQILLHCVPPLM
jgi:hypothetical protein